MCSSRKRDCGCVAGIGMAKSALSSAESFNSFLSLSRNSSLRASKTTFSMRFVFRPLHFFGPSLIGASSSSRCERLPVRGDRSNLAGALEGGGLGSFPMAIADRKRRWTESECRQSATACFGIKTLVSPRQAPSWAEKQRKSVKSTERRDRSARLCFVCSWLVVTYLVCRFN